MPVHVTCHCGQLLVVPENRAGATVRCPRCGASVNIPPTSMIQPAAEPAALPPENAELKNDSGEFPVIQPVSHGRLQWESHQHRAVNVAYWLAIALVLVALTSAVPVLVVVLAPGAPHAAMQIEPWAYVIIFSALLQCAYLVYLVQIPDWSTMRVISILTLLHATQYAMLAGIRILASPENPVLRWLGLGGSRFSVGQQASWCLLMVLLHGTLCYLAGHLASRWKARATV